MILLLFFVLLIQFFSFWIFEPFTSFVGYVFELRFFPTLILLALILIFSVKNIEEIK